MRFLMLGRGIEDFASLPVPRLPDITKFDKLAIHWPIFQSHPTTISPSALLFTSKWSALASLYFICYVKIVDITVIPLTVNFRIFRSLDMPRAHGMEKSLRKSPSERP